MSARRRCLALASFAAIVTVTACTSGDIGYQDDAAGVTLASIRSAGSTCPLSLADAAEDAKHPVIEPTGSPTGSPSPSVSVEASPSSGTVLAQIDGVSVECTVSIDGGTLSVLLLASTQPKAAAPSLLPAVLVHAGLPSSAVSPIADAITHTESGDLVQLPGDPPVALGIVTVGGAKSAAFELDGDGVEASVIQAVGERLADRMS